MGCRIKPGQIVQSRAGRDRGNYYIVIDIEDDCSFVFLADGERKKVERPKKKNPKHLNRFNKVVEDIRAKCQSRMRVTNDDVTRALEKVREND